MVGVEACCIGNSCLKQSSFKALVDSGTSFTFLPQDVFEKVAEEVLSSSIELHLIKSQPLSLMQLPFLDSLTVK